MKTQSKGKKRPAAKRKGAAKSFLQNRCVRNLSRGKVYNRRVEPTSDNEKKFMKLDLFLAGFCLIVF